MLKKKSLFAFFLILCLALSGCGEMTALPEASAEVSAEASVSASSSESAEAAPEESLPDAEPEASVVEEEPEEAPEPEPEPVCLTAEEAAAMDAGTILPAEELPEDVSGFFYRKHISKKVWKRMKGVSYKEGCPVSREELRYVRVLHWGFDGETHIGELVCNKDVAKDFVKIFRKLYQKGYPIEKMLLVDEYGGDDELSMEDNNTSCFNYRAVSGSTTISRHAYGLAIDINPLYNPYITSRGYEPENAGDYVDRDGDCPYFINSEDPCYKLMDKYGFAWGGWWDSVKDYQHFER